MSKYIIYIITKNRAGIIEENEFKLAGMFKRKYKNLGHAKAVARTNFEEMRPKGGKIEDVFVKDEYGNILFKAKRFDDGIYRKQ